MPNEKVNLNDREAVQKFFEDIDREVDPYGQKAMKKLDFKVMGPICYEKGFANVKDALKALEINKSRINNILNTAKQ